MDKHPIESIMATTMESIRDMVDVNTVVGEAIAAPDGSTVIPVSPRGLRLRGRRRGIQVRKTGRRKRRPSPAAPARASASSPWASSSSAADRCASCRRRPTLRWTASSKWFRSCSRSSKAPCKAAPAKRRSRPRARAEGAVASARIASNRRAPRVLKFLSGTHSMPRQARRLSRAGRGRSHAVFGRSARVGGGEPLALILHITAEARSPSPDRR